MKELPADLADPLHILAPIPWQALAWLALLGVLASLWWLWRKLRDRRLPAVGPPPAAARRPLFSGIRSVIDQIQQRYLEADPRRGCHELSAALRDHFQHKSGHRLSTATVGEMMAVLGDGAVPRMFKLLAGLQFRRREPTPSDFRGACEVAREVVSARGALRK